MSEYEHQHAHRCPVCHREQEFAAGTEGNLERPTRGAVMLCWYCKGIGIYDESFPGNTRLPSGDELAEIMADPSVRKALQVISTAATPHDAARRMQ